MRKQGKKVTCIAMAAAIMLSLAACEKKSETITGYNDVKQGSTEAADTSSESTEAAAAVVTEEEQNIEPYTWSEKITGDGKVFNTLSINIKMKGHYDEPSKTFTVRTDDYNSELIKEICTRVFGDSAEVYDYKARTKRICDADIEMYNGIKAMYQDEDAGIYQNKYHSEEAPTQEDYDNAYKEIDSRIAAIEEEKESAPDTVANDYSYGGYIGNIQNEEYYMYFGNRNYEEYVQSPTTYQFDGRICTIFKKDLSNLFEGSLCAMAEEIPMGWKGKDCDVPEDLVAQAESFVDAIGFSDYQFSDEQSTGFYIQKGINPATFQVLGIPMSLYQQGVDGTSGYTVKFTLGGETDRTLGSLESDIETYGDNYDIMDINSYIIVFVSSDYGVIGCELHNPMTVTGSEEVQIISEDKAKTIIVDNINNPDAWNVAIDHSSKDLEINTLKLISFPIRSPEDKHEYTYVPAFLFSHTHRNGGRSVQNLVDIANGYELFSDPCIIVNALDGSLINVKNEVGDHFSGYMRGNEGYTELFDGEWERNRMQENAVNAATEDN